MATMPYLNLISILIFLLIVLAVFVYVLFKKDFRIKNGDKEFTLSKDLNKNLEKKIEEYQKVEFRDKNLQMEMYRHSLKIDSKCRSDMRRIIRDLDEKVDGVLAPFIGCEYLSVNILQVLQSELLQRIDENNLREKLAKSYISGYIRDIIYRLKTKYAFYLTKTTICNLNIPSWEDIEPEVQNIVSRWAVCTRGILVDSITEKIQFYKKFENSFKTAEYKESAVTFPISKNENYINDIVGGLSNLEEL